MEPILKQAIENYQCSGCIVGGDTSCYERNHIPGPGSVGCGKHQAGTTIGFIGTIFLGMPRGFNRLGEYTSLRPVIFKSFETAQWDYNQWNIPVWKYLSKDGHTFVRGLTPRLNEPFIHVYLEDCMDRIECLEITQDFMDYMD